MGAVFVDLDRTLVRGASGRVLHHVLEAAGIARALPADGLLYGVYDRVGETLPAMALARAAALASRGWSQAAVQEAGSRAVPDLMALLAPYAPGILAEHRRAGRRLVLTTTTPLDMIAPFADAVGFDAVLATRYGVRDGCYTGRLDGGFVWGVGKLAAARRWASAAGMALSDCEACSDSFFDLPLLASVGKPHVVNPDPRLAVVALARRWPIEHWDRPAGVPSLLGLEPYHLLRPWVRAELFPYARFELSGLDHIPVRGPVLLAANHRSYFDVAALALVAARVGRPVRFLAKRELFDAPIAGALTRAIGGIPVDRGGRADDALRRAEDALRAGEVVIVLPQGTIPRGASFFAPTLEGRTGTARLAASTGAPVVPIGLWGTERVWPRRARVPNLAAVVHPPVITVRVGPPVILGLTDARADTATLMGAIAGLLPDGARTRRRPSDEELAATFPPGTSPPGTSPPGTR